MSATLDLSAEELAGWLVERAPDRLWSVEGENELEQSLSLPCPGTELAAELLRRGGNVRLRGPAHVRGESGRDLGRLAPVAYGSRDDIVLRATWLRDGSESGEWFIVTDLLAEEATRSAHAS
jgi:hypothetical protein